MDDVALHYLRQNLEGKLKEQISKLDNKKLQKSALSDLPSALNDFAYKDFFESILDRYKVLAQRNLSRLKPMMLLMLDGTAQFQLKAWWERLCR